ncbi:hypothetical protein ACLOJK_028790 [Asimina triloba]
MKTVLPYKTGFSMSGGAMASGGQATPSPPPGFTPYRLAQTLNGHTRAVSCVKFSNDGSLLASSSLDKTLIVWSSRTLERLWQLRGHSEGISDLAWSSDSHYICSASDDRTLRIWDAVSGDCVKILRGHTSFVFCVNFNCQSNLIVSGSFDETLRLWDLKNGGRCLRVITGHTEPVTSVHFNRDDSIIVSGSHDGTCRIWDSATGTCLKKIGDDRDKTVAISFAKFSPNGKFILLATLDNSLKLWNYQQGKANKAYTGHVNKVYCITSTFSVTNGKYIVSGSEDNCVYLWDLQGRNVVQKLEGHTDTVISVCCHPSENKIASAGLHEDRTGSHRSAPLWLWKLGGLLSSPRELGARPNVDLSVVVPVSGPPWQSGSNVSTRLMTERCPWMVLSHLSFFQQAKSNSADGFCNAISLSDPPICALRLDGNTHVLYHLCAYTGWL